MQRKRNTMRVKSNLKR